MAKKILTPDEMAEARRLYEKEGWGYGRIATKFSVSKPTVQGWAKNWQRDYGVAPLPAGKKADAGAGAAASQAKVTENAVPSETQGAATYPGMVASEPARVVADVYVAPAAPANDYADEIRIPDGLDEVDREEFVKAAIVGRQRAINGRHLKELNAARSKLYESLKKAGTKEGAGTALASQRNVAALIALQAAEMEAELQRVRLEVAEFVGKPLKPSPCRIVVHMQEGAQIGGAEVYGPNAFEVIDQQGKVI
ncbi:helix-turn-helix domain-containing protein [Paraburkholderia sp. BCC1876]|uniref:helix-turn-helix domain-containing protein n=1 Tax=Paraburkholderia sp. BCC1876 TaxID=2676303 RepID=UPI00158FFC4F|nr:helix-turn-helix domain-containing protein [Paraburkholderia sp. BCC1876]